MTWEIKIMTGEVFRGNAIEITDTDYKLGEDCFTYPKSDTYEFITVLNKMQYSFPKDKVLYAKRID